MNEPNNPNARIIDTTITAKPLSHLPLTVVLLLVISIGMIVLFFGLKPLLFRPEAVSETPTVPTSLPAPVIVIPQWKTFLNPQFSYSIQYPPDTEPVVNNPSDIYRHFVTFVETKTDNTGKSSRFELFSLTIRSATLGEEVKFQRSRIEGHVPMAVTGQKSFTQDGVEGIRTDYGSTNGKEETLTLMSFYRAPDAFTFYFANFKDPSLAARIISTLSFY